MANATYRIESTEEEGPASKSTDKRLLILRPSMGQGGADRVTLNLLQLIDQDKFDVHLVLTKARGELFEEIPEGVNVHSLNARSLSTAWLPLMRVIRRIDPDVVFSTSSGANIIAVIARLLNGKQARLVLSERNVLYHGGKTIKRRIVVLLKRLLYHKADCITSVSGGVREDLIQTLGLSPTQIRVVYNPIVTDDLPMLMKEEINHPWFRETTPIVLGVGRLVREKDFKTLIEAFSVVHEKRECRLVILGSGPLEADLKRLVKRLSLSRDVWFAGYDKNPFRYMSKCSVFVLSSRDEGLPGVLIQAMACGAPVVATNCHAGPAEIVTEGIDGFLVPVGDVNEMAERIEFCLVNQDASRRMAEAGRLTANKFSAETVLPRYLDALIH